MFLQNFSRLNTILWRRYSDKIRKEFTVLPNVNINLVLSFKTVIKPLDVVDYPECDKLIIICEKALNTNQIGESININSAKEPYDSNITCEIIAPIKSNFNVNAMGGIKIANFLGEGVRLFSQYGDINIGKTQSDHVQATTSQGDIITDGEISASKVVLKSLKKGNINASNIKCLGLSIETEDGEINTESSYCDESYFVTRNGRMNLRNVHKHSRVVVDKNGELNMTGFDGLLEATMQNGKADIQISRITQKSDIRIKGEGKLMLRLSDEVINNCSIDIFSPCCAIDDGIPFKEDEETETTSINHENLPKDAIKLKIQAAKSQVTVTKGSWADMVKKSIEDNSMEVKQ